jgi:hypothetical protein
MEYLPKNFDKDDWEVISDPTVLQKGDYIAYYRTKEYIQQNGKVSKANKFYKGGYVSFVNINNEQKKPYYFIGISTTYGRPFSIKLLGDLIVYRSKKQIQLNRNLKN